MNGDFISDIIIGGYLARTSGGDPTGEASVVLGAPGGFPASLEVSSLDGTNGFVLEGIDSMDECGTSVSGAGDLNGDGIGDLVIGAQNAAPGGRNLAGEAYVVLVSPPSCAAGRVNAANGFVLNVLLVDGTAGGADRTVLLSADEAIDCTMMRPANAGSGKFVLHADLGEPGAVASTLPFDIGWSCFPFLVSEGAGPILVANGIGRENLVGESQFFGVPQADPDRAPTTMTYPPQIPIGTTLTFQGIVVDTGAFSTKSVSTTNAVTLKIVP